MTKSPTATRFLAIIGLALSYFLAGKIGLHFASVNPSAAAIWAPAGIALAGVLLMGYRIWPAIAAAAFLVNLTTAGSMATSIAIASGNTLEALAGAYLINRFANGRHIFERTMDAVKFLLLAAIVSTAVSACIGVTSLCLGGYARWSEYGWIWLTWWFGDATGDLIVAPVILLWATNFRVTWTRKQACEGALLLFSVAADRRGPVRWLVAAGQSALSAGFRLRPGFVVGGVSIRSARDRGDDFDSGGDRHRRNRQWVRSVCAGQSQRGSPAVADFHGNNGPDEHRRRDRSR